MKTKNKTIWKFNLKPIDVNKIQMPKGAEIVSVQFQDKNICLWALVNPLAEEEIRNFGLIGTGDIINQENGQYITTLQFEKAFGVFNQVWHLFEF
jgi:hypothetical protein